KDDVTYGQKLADTDSPVAAPIHASANGKISGSSVVLLPSGRRVPALSMKPAEDGQVLPPDFLAQFLERDWSRVEPSSYEPEEICQTIRECGVVGLGGATFPTHIKLKRNPQRP